MRDHRIPGDYKYTWNEPMTNTSIIRGFKKWFANRLYTKSHVVFIVGGAWLFVIPSFFIFAAYRKAVTGTWNRLLEPGTHIYRAPNYTYQLSYNTNPDNWWVSTYNCWSSDPMCGLDSMPKRPWEVLKNPEKNMFKLQRDETKSIRKEWMGGFL